MPEVTRPVSELALEVRKKRQQRGKQFFAYSSDKGEACKKAAAMVGANRHYVTDAKKIDRDAPEILDHVKQGKLSIPQAKQVAALPVAQRPAAIERIQKKETEEGEDIYRDGDLVARCKLRRANMRPRRAKVRQFFSVSKGAWLRRLQCRI